MDYTMRIAEATDIDDSLNLDTLRTTLWEHPVQLAILFGSHATATTHSMSDIDIAVELEEHHPSDRGYNDAFLGLSADLSDALDTDEVDLVDLHAVSPALTATIFDHGILLIGDQERADELRRQATVADSETQSPREQLDTALARIDTHLGDDDIAVPVTGESENNAPSRSQ